MIIGVSWLGQGWGGRFRKDSTLFASSGRMGFRRVLRREKAFRAVVQILAAASGFSFTSVQGSWSLIYLLTISAWFRMSLMAF